MSSTSQLDIAWAAGFIDGEGCIALCHHRQRTKGRDYECFVLRLSVANTDLRSLQRLKSMFGGSINSASRKGRPNHKPCWTWYCTSAKAQNALEILLPHLFGKREQAELGLLSRRYIQANGRPRAGDAIPRQAAIASQLKHLKRVV